jgi:serine/threonine-protein kinase RIO1
MMIPSYKDTGLYSPTYFVKWDKFFGVDKTSDAVLKNQPCTKIKRYKGMPMSMRRYSQFIDARDRYNILSEHPQSLDDAWARREEYQDRRNAQRMKAYKMRT